MIPAGIMTPMLDSSLLEWARECAVAPDSVYLLVHNKFVSEARSSGWWDTLHGIRLLNAPSDGYLINLKYPTERMTEVGTASHQAYYGWQGDGSTGYLNTGKTPAQLDMTAGATPSITALVFSQSDIPGVYGACGATGGVNTGVVRLRSGAVMGVWGSSLSQVQTPVVSGRGLSGVVINSTSGGFVQKNGANIAILGTATSLATGTFRYGRGGSGSAYEPAMLAYGFDGPSITEAQANSIETAVKRTLIALGTLIEDEPAVPIGINNAFLRTDTGDWTGSIGRILQPPMSDSQENVTQYTRVKTAITWTADAYSTVAGDLGTTLEATAGETAKTVTLMSAVTAGASAIQVVRKMDRGSADITVNGFALSEQYDFVVYISDGAAWNKAQDYLPSIRITTGFEITFTADAYTTVITDRGRNLQATAGATNKTVTLLTAATSNSGSSVFVRKIDSGIGVVTVNGVDLVNENDWVYFVSNGTTWIRNVLYRPDSEWVSNNYTAKALDLGRNIHATAGSYNRTVTLMSAASAGNGASVVTRKMDDGVGTVTVNGVVLSNMYDYASFVSDGVSWIQDQTVKPLEIGYIAFPATNLSIRPWGHAQYAQQTLITVDEFIWGTRGLGQVAGEITAWAKKGNDTMGGIVLTNKFSGRTEFDTYELAMGEMLTKVAYTLGYLPQDDPTLTTFDGEYRAGGWGFLDIAEHFGYDVSSWAAHVSSTVSNVVDNGAGLVRITTSAAHGVTSGDTVQVSGVVGVPAANTTAVATLISATVTNATNNGSGLVRITTSAAHDITSGNIIQVSGVVGVTAANTTAVATVINTTTFDLVGTTFSGTYTSGGTAQNLSTFDLIGTAFSGTYTSGGTMKNNTVLTTDVNIDTGAVGHRAYFFANRDTIFVDDAVSGQFKVVRNKILLGQGRLADIRTRGYQPVGGISLDLEWADNRSPEQFVRSIRGLARLCHVKNYTLRTLSHAAHKGSGTYSGWRKSNAYALLAGAPGVDGIDENIDQHVLLAQTSAPTPTDMVNQIIEQMQFFRGEDGSRPIPIDHFCLELRIGGTGQEIGVYYVTALRSLLSVEIDGVTYDFSNVWITPLYAQFGGDIDRIPNQRLAQFLGISQD